jgi:type IV pilus assembly protein PilB
MLGELLIAAGVLGDEQLRAALAEQRKWGDRLGRTLVEMGFVSEDALAQALAEQLWLPTCRPDRDPLPPGVAGLLGVHSCERYGVMPLGLAGGVLRVATADPSNAPLLDELASLTGVRVEPVIATETSIARAIRKHYYGEPVVPPEVEAPPPPAALDDPGLVTVELTPIDPPPAPPPSVTLEPIPIDVTPGPSGGAGESLPVDAAPRPGVDRESLPVVSTPAPHPDAVREPIPLASPAAPDDRAPAPDPGGVAPVPSSARAPAATAAPRFSTGEPAAPPVPADPAARPPPLDVEVEWAPPAEVVVAQLREAVDGLEGDLAREVRVLRGLVDTLIARGLITREEFLEHVRARGG